jgi:hypothetical protein
MLDALDSSESNRVRNLRIRKKIGSSKTFVSGMIDGVRCNVRIPETFHERTIDGQANRAWVARVIREEMSK